jgi:hypothetical protein
LHRYWIEFDEPGLPAYLRRFGVTAFDIEDAMPPEHAPTVGAWGLVPEVSVLHVAHICRSGHGARGQNALVQPLLLLDVDGVLNPLGVSVPAGYERHRADAYNVLVCQRHGEWLRSLIPMFEFRWVTTWGAAASEVFGKLLDLPPMDAVELGVLPREGTRKLAAVTRCVEDRPCAWVDDELYEDAFMWAASRAEPTLLVRTSATVGLREADVDELRTFALAIAAAP